MANKKKLFGAALLAHKRAQAAIDRNENRKSGRKKAIPPAKRPSASGHKSSSNAPLLKGKQKRKITASAASKQSLQELDNYIEKEETKAIQATPFIRKSEIKACIKRYGKPTYIPKEFLIKVNAWVRSLLDTGAKNKANANTLKHEPVQKTRPYVVHTYAKAYVMEQWHVHLQDSFTMFIDALIETAMEKTAKLRENSKTVKTLVMVLGVNDDKPIIETNLHADEAGQLSTVQIENKPAEPPKVEEQVEHWQERKTERPTIKVSKDSTLQYNFQFVIVSDEVDVLYGTKSVRTREGDAKAEELFFISVRQHLMAAGFDLSLIEIKIKTVTKERIG